MKERRDKINSILPQIEQQLYDGDIEQQLKQLDLKKDIKETSATAISSKKNSRANSRSGTIRPTRTT